MVTVGEPNGTRKCVAGGGFCTTPTYGDQSYCFKHLLQVPVRECFLSTRAMSVLSALGCQTVADIVNINSVSAIAKVRNAGSTTAMEIRLFVERIGFKVGL